MDRLCRQPRARQPDHRLAPRRSLRPPQHRQPRRPHRPQLPVGASVRGRCPQSPAHHRLRALRLRRRRGGTPARGIRAAR